MSNNLELWNKVEKTNPEYTKSANVRGNKITAIAPQYQIKKATEQFGAYGQTWGFRTINIEPCFADKGLALFLGEFFYPNGGFTISSSIGLYRDNAQTKIDDDFAKKLETDALTKALSKLGFNADVFMGKFDDNKYVQSLKSEFKEEYTKGMFLAEADRMRGSLQSSKSTHDAIIGFLEETYQVSDEIKKEIRGL